MTEDLRWLSVAATAAKLGFSEDTIRAKIKAGELPAVRSGPGARAPWMVNATALEEQIQSGRDQPPRGGYGPAGAEIAGVAAAMSLGLSQDEADALIADRLDSYRRSVALDAAADSLREDPGFIEALVEINAADREEEEARRIAEEYRRRERIRRRAEQILEEDDEE